MNPPASSRSWSFPSHPVLLAALIFLPVAATCVSVPLGCDEAIWTYMGRVWFRDHLPPYTGAFDNKPMGIIAIYGLAWLAAGVNTWLIRLLGAAATVACGLLLHRIARRLLDGTN